MFLCLQVSVFESVDLGTTVLRVSATDADSGLFAVIGYSLVDGEGKFNIKPTTVSLPIYFNNNNGILYCRKLLLDISTFRVFTVNSIV